MIYTYPFEDLGPDYMANFSPANRAEIPARLLKQILLKSNCRLHGVGFSPGRNSARAENPNPVYSNRARIFSLGKRAEKSLSVCISKRNFSPGWKAGNKMAAATKKKRFQWNKADKIENLSLISKLRGYLRTSRQG